MKKGNIFLTVLIGILVFLFITGYGSMFILALLSAQNFAFKYFIVIILIAIYITLLYLLYKVIKSRLRELKGGDYDDLGKY